MFLGKRCLKICIIFTQEYLCGSANSIKLQRSIIEITLWHGYSPVNLLHIFRIPFYTNISEWLLLTDHLLNKTKRIIHRKKTKKKTPKPSSLYMERCLLNKILTKQTGQFFLTSVSGKIT